MAKKIRFSLEMENGTKIRTLDELRENFSLTKVVEYFDNQNYSTGWRIGIPLA